MFCEPLLLKTWQVIELHRRLDWNVGLRVGLLSVVGRKTAEILALSPHYVKS